MLRGTQRCWQNWLEPHREQKGHRGIYNLALTSYMVLWDDGLTLRGSFRRTRMNAAQLSGAQTDPPGPTPESTGSRQAWPCCTIACLPVDKEQNHVKASWGEFADDKGHLCSDSLASQFSPNTACMPGSPGKASHSQDGSLGSVHIGQWEAEPRGLGKVLNPSVHGQDPS